MDSENHSLLLEGPAIPPPPGVVADLDAPLSQPAYAVPVAIFTIVLCTVCMILRMVTQIGIHKRFGRDDGKHSRKAMEM